MLGFRVERVTKGSYYYDYAGRWEERFTIVAVREGGMKCECQAAKKDEGRSNVRAPLLVCHRPAG